MTDVSVTTTSLQSNDDDVLQDSEVITILNLSKSIHHYGIHTIYFCGIIGNVLSFLVFSRKAFKGSIAAITFKVLAVSDTCFLLSYGTVHVIRPYMSYSVMDIKLVCDTVAYAFTAFKLLSAWTIVFIAIERMIAIMWPHKAKVIFTLKTVKRVIGFMIFGILSLCILVPFTLGTGSDGYCTKGKIVAMFDLIAGSLIPFCLIVLCNVITITKLTIYFINRRRNLTASNSATPSPLTGMTSTLLMVCATFLILTFPIDAYYIYQSTNPTGALLVAWMTVWHSSARLLLASNHSINLLLYCITGHKFRDQFKAMFMICIPFHRYGMTKESFGSIGSTQISTVS